MAALERLGELERISERLDPEWFVPQVGQGALALEARDDDEPTLRALSSIDDAWASVCLRCERSFLAELGAGCSIPAGAYATFNGETIHLRGVMLDLDGSASVRAVLAGNEPVELGRRLARHLRDDLGGGAFDAGP